MLAIWRRRASAFLGLLVASSFFFCGKDVLEIDRNPWLSGTKPFLKQKILHVSASPPVQL